MTARFLLASIVFLAGACALCLALDGVSTRTAAVYAVERGRIERLLDRAEEITDLAAGNSQGRSVAFDALGLDGFHLWRAGADLAENEYLLRTFLPRLPSVRRVVFVLSHFSFQRDNSLELEVDRRAIRRQLYAVAPGAQWVRGDFLGWVGGRMGTLARQDHWWEVMQVLAGAQDPVDPRAVAAIHDDGMPTAAVNLRRRTPEELQRHAQESRVPRQLRISRESLQLAPETPDRCERSLLAIVELCREASVELLFVLPPVSRAYAEAYDPAVVRDMRRRMDRLVSEHGIRFHDFYEDAEFADRAEWFMDSDHLNRDGARAFSELRLAPLLR